MKGVFFGPPDWFAERTSARLRRAIAFWIGVSVAVPLTVLSFPLRQSVSMLWALSMLALILSCFAMTAAETPVETEDE